MLDTVELDKKPPVKHPFPFSSSPVHTIYIDYTVFFENEFTKFRFSIHFPVPMTDDIWSILFYLLERVQIVLVLCHSRRVVYWIYLYHMLFIFSKDQCALFIPMLFIFEVQHDIAIRLYLPASLVQAELISDNSIRFQYKFMTLFNSISLPCPKAEDLTFNS